MARIKSDLKSPLAALLAERDIATGRISALQAERLKGAPRRLWCGHTAMHIADQLSEFNGAVVGLALGRVEGHVLDRWCS